MNRRRGLSGEVLTESGPAIARLLALIVLIAAVTLAAILLTRPRGTYEVNAIFDDSRGLIQGGEVTAGSQKVGSVKEIELGDEDGLPRVRMEIDSDFRLHRGAAARIQMASNVGAVNRVVDLTEGDPDGPELDDGATLGPSQTDQPVDLDEAVSALDPKTRADAARLLAGLDAATAGRGPDLKRLPRHSSSALNQTANVLGEAAADQPALRSLVADTATVVDALARRPGDLAAAADQTAALLQTTGAREADLRASVREIGPAFSSGTKTLRALDASIPDIRDLLADARPTVERLGPVAERLPQTTRLLRPALGQARQLIDAFPSQAKSLKPAIDDAIPLLRELQPLLVQFNPLLDQLRAHTPEVVSFFSLGGDAIANYDINGHSIRFIPRLIQFPTHAGLIGPDASGPGSLVRPFDRMPGVLEGDPWTGYSSSFIGGADAAEVP